MAITTQMRILDNRGTQLDPSRPTLADMALPWIAPQALLPQSYSVASLRSDIRVKIASTRREWAGAFQLLADNYRARGYDAGAEADFRFTAAHALPDTVVLVAKNADEQVVATLSLFPDNTRLGLPLESLYPAEIQKLRSAGHRLFEGGCLADRELSPRAGLLVVQALIGLAWRSLRELGATTNVITVNPRHWEFYRKVYGYEPLGPVRAYAAVEGHPAEAYFLSPQLMRARAPQKYREIFEAHLPWQTLTAPRIPPQLIRYFARHSSQTDLRSVEDLLHQVEQFGSPTRWYEKRPRGISGNL